MCRGSLEIALRVSSLKDHGKLVTTNPERTARTSGSGYSVASDL
jgi:hypothetical protein